MTVPNRPTLLLPLLGLHFISEDGVIQRHNKCVFLGLVDTWGLTSAVHAELSVDPGVTAKSSIEPAVNLSIDIEPRKA